MALTSKFGGQNALGSLVGDASAFLQLRRVDVGSMNTALEHYYPQANVELSHDRLDVAKINCIVNGVNSISTFLFLFSKTEHRSFGAER